MEADTAVMAAKHCFTSIYYRSEINFSEVAITTKVYCVRLRGMKTRWRSAGSEHLAGDAHVKEPIIHD